MSLTSGYMDLNSALKDLTVRWEELAQVWQDAVRHEFERDTWEPLVARTAAALRAMDRLGPVLLKMRQDCG
jgi:hypothetical protein